MGEWLGTSTLKLREVKGPPPAPCRCWARITTTKDHPGLRTAGHRSWRSNLPFVHAPVISFALGASPAVCACCCWLDVRCALASRTSTRNPNSNSNYLVPYVKTEEEGREKEREARNQGALIKNESKEQRRPGFKCSLVSGDPSNGLVGVASRDHRARACPQPGLHAKEREFK